MNTQPICKDNLKVAIIGCGNVGATTAYALLLDGVVTELVLIDAGAEKAEGMLLDLEHSLAFTQNVRLSAGTDVALCADADIVIVTAGARQKEGQTRLELVATNKEIFAQIIPAAAKVAPESIILVITNPVDVLTYHALKLSGFPSSRVFGTGTMLDTARLRFHLSEKLNVNPSSINAYVLGEHGDTSFPAYSSATIGGVPFFSFPGATKELASSAYENTKNAAYRIIHDLGYTCYSIATVAREIVRHIFHNSRAIVPLSTLLKNYHGVDDLSLSVPCIIGRNGIESVIDLPMSPEETQQFQASAATIKGLL